MNEAMKEEILDVLEDLCGDSIVRDEPDLDLFEEGLLDSLLTIELLAIIEDRYGLSIAPTEIGQGEFSTAERIVSSLSKRLS